MAPRLHAAGTMKDGRGFQVMERIQTKDLEGLPHPGTKNSSGKEIEKLDSDQLYREKEAYKASLLLNQRGVSHEDLHGGNLKWDESKNRPVIMDFDNSRVDRKAAKAEASSTLNSIGIRLENAGYYDEADKFYRLGTKVGKSSDKTTDNLLKVARDLVDSDFPE